MGSFTMNRQQNNIMKKIKNNSFLQIINNKNKIKFDYLRIKIY